MEHKRILRGNNTTIPTGAEVLSTNITYAVTDKSKTGKGNIPLSSEECVAASREFMMENEK